MRTKAVTPSRLGGASWRPGPGIPVLSLFSGAGGLDQGFSGAGFRSRVAIDNWAPAVKTYRANHPKTFAFNLDLSGIDTEVLIEIWEAVSNGERPVGIMGGPPCQSFSVSNVHQRPTDPRSDLPGHYVRILDAFNTKYSLDFFVFENVPGLLTARHRHRFEQFVEQCRQVGFVVTYELLDAVDFGVPQFRERVIVVGVNGQRHKEATFEFPEGNKQGAPVEEVIGGLPEPVYFERGKTSGNGFHPNHWCLKPKSWKFENGSLRPGTVMGRSFRVLDWKKPSWTVAYGHREVHIHPDGRRRLSVYEAMLLQSFPRTYVLHGTLSQQITLVSDAVPPPVAEALALQLKRSLGLVAREPGGPEI